MGGDSRGLQREVHAAAGLADTELRREVADDVPAVVESRRWCRGAGVCGAVRDTWWQVQFGQQLLRARVVIEPRAEAVGVTTARVGEGVREITPAPPQLHLPAS